MSEPLPIHGFDVHTEIEYQELTDAYDRMRRRDPCDRCGKEHPMWHHATCFGENLCHDCYMKNPTICVQHYRGDFGYAPWFPEQEKKEVIDE